jgi:hypothetical protein
MSSLPSQTILWRKLQTDIGVDDEDVQAMMIASFEWYEFGMLIIYVVRCLRGLLKLMSARTDCSSKKNSKLWIAVGEGFKHFVNAGMWSVMKMLPQVKIEAQNSFKAWMKYRDGLQTEGILTTRNRWKSFIFVLCEFGPVLLFAIVALNALHWKMAIIQYIFHKSIHRWTRAQWFAFLAFANQVAGVVPIRLMEKETLLNFVFAGADAEMDKNEKKALMEFSGMLHKRIFQDFPGCKGMLASLTITAVDVQKLLLIERTFNDDDQGEAKS